MALDFPPSTQVGQLFVAQNGATYQWDGSKWTTQIKPYYPVLGANPGPNPPSNPIGGTLWWDSVSGQLYTYYDDGQSSQWVEASTS